MNKFAALFSRKFLNGLFVGLGFVVLLGAVFAVTNSDAFKTYYDGAEFTDQKVTRNEWKIVVDEVARLGAGMGMVQEDLATN